MRTRKDGLPRMGYCIQIGLHKNAEAIFVTQKGWRNQIPPIGWADLNFSALKDYYFSHWNFLGVDADPESIKFCLKEWGISENFAFLQAHIGYRTGEIVKASFDVDYHNPEGWDANHFYMPTLSLADLIAGWGYASSGNNVDLLIIDVDGGEWAIFSAYDWKVKPSLIIVEHNDTCGCDKQDFIDFITEQGYELYDEISLYIEETQYDQGRNLHFRLKETNP